MIRRRPTAVVGFLLPAVAVYGLFVGYPLLRAAVLSFTDSTGGPAHYVGLANYRALADDPVVGAALRHTIAYTAVVVVVQNAVGLALAAALFRRPAVRRALGTLLLLPALVAPMLAAFTWSSLLSRGGAPSALLGHPVTAIGSVAAVTVWRSAGVSCAIVLAGYALIPRELLDAAAVDGAAGWQRFRRIEWPLLAPAMTVSVTLSLVGALKAFELPLVLTDGRTVSLSQTLAVAAYQRMFGSGSAQLAYGTAVALLLLAVVAVVGWTVSSLLRLRELRLLEAP